MEIVLINGSQATLVTQAPYPLPEQGFLWLDAAHEEVAADTGAWRDAVERVTSVHVYDPHLSDVVNLAHPSYFDPTQDYAMLVFRKLALNGEADDGSASADAGVKRKIPPALNKLATKPVAFLLMDRALVTVHGPHSRMIETTRNRLLEQRQKRDGYGHGGRPVGSPAELLLRLLNAMVDQYLELRQPLTSQIDRWQRALLDPRRPFNDWIALLDARIELRKLDHLCEGQHDALQELRDYLIDNQDDDNSGRANDLLLVRVNDVMEHITRVLNHARRLESSIESAVQIHFSAVAHRTNDIMRTLTVITALFMPLTLITGIFGMNFHYIPLLENRVGFWITMGAMAVIAFAMWLFFRRKRYLEGRAMNRDS